MLKLLKSLFVLLLLAGIAAAIIYVDYQKWLKTPLDLPAQGLSLQVHRGESLSALAQRLQNDGVIKRAWYFRVLARLNGQARSIKAGEFHVLAGTLPEQLLNQLIAGKVVQYSLTVIEGWRFEDLLQAIQSSPDLRHTLLQDLPLSELNLQLGLNLKHTEGWFLPDTYHFPRGTTDVEFLKRAHKAMQNALQQAWQGRDKNLPLKSPYEALILASIIEKETARADERKRIAGVFISRLKKGMLLQTDPTVIYGMGEHYKGNIRRKDLRQDTPYNTYVHKGLTPTPIALPGKAALEAAVHPIVDGSLYFVATGKDGAHYFSRTLKQHNAAVRRYQLKKHP
ncbi:MAG: endolytic transglycosylase MltG [gamma proteobacterium symbiont of Bathyaustriella thionipta]|nr:endolytic transglycosylase MltG [gamma proteobacterium symbiont of Bathyaustriella thionipta]